MRLRKPKLALASSGLAGVVALVAMTQPFGSGPGCSNTASAAVGAPTTPPAGSLTAPQLVAYFERNNWSPNAAAGIVGNMSQESGLNPADPGGGLVQNIGTMWSAQVAYDTKHNLDPNSESGQLEFLVWYVPQQSWWPQFDGAKTPQDAALWFQNGYEQCSGAGVSGTDQKGGGLCNPDNRMSQAAAALGSGSQGSATFVSANVGASGACTATMVGGATNPAPGATWLRLDMGFDGNYSQTRGAVAPYDGIVYVPGITGWPGQGVYFYIVNADQTGPDYTRAMYFAEGATPLVANGTRVKAGQPIGKPVAVGGDSHPGNFEIGPAQVKGGDTLAKQYILNSPAARQEVLAFYNWMRTLGAGVSPNTSAAGGT